MNLTQISSHSRYVQQNPGSVANGGDPPHDGGMEARLARLESTSEHILRELVEMKTDVRELRKNARADFYWMLGGFTAMLAVMAHGFHWL